MDHLYLLIAKLFCLGAAGFVFYLLHLINGNAILEIAYRPAARRKMKKKRKEFPRWDRFLHWSLVRQAPIRSGKLWIYWGLHLVAIFGLSASLVLFFIPIQITAWHSGIARELYCPVVTFVAQTGMRIVIDLIVLPSEQNRYGIKKPDKR